MCQNFFSLGPKESPTSLVCLSKPVLWSDSDLLACCWYLMLCLLFMLGLRAAASFFLLIMIRTLTAQAELACAIFVFSFSFLDG